MRYVVELNDRDYQEGLRDQFATAALPVIVKLQGGNPHQFDEIAKQAYLVADAMLVARKPKIRPLQVAVGVEVSVEVK